MRRVVKVGGRAQGDPRLPAALAAAGRADALCVVHGGGDEVSAMQRRLGLEPTFVGGRRVTSEADLDVVRMVLSGTINKRLVAQLLAHGVHAVGLSGEDALLFSARITRPAMGRVGGDVTVNGSVVEHLLDGGFTPVISPMARDADAPHAGLNVNGDDAAAALAVALRADELVLVADVAGVLDAGSLVPVLDAERARAFIADGTAAGGMAAKLEAAAAALHGGVSCVRITGLDGIAEPGAGSRVILSPSPV